jgi:hypothetical protein
MEKGTKVQVEETSFKWAGTVLWTEQGFGGRWLTIRPEEYGTHVRRGSSAYEYEYNWISVPEFINKVQAI